MRKIGKGKSAPKELQVPSFGVCDRIEKDEQATYIRKDPRYLRNFAISLQQPLF